jgi:hypothetical protein
LLADYKDRRLILRPFVRLHRRRHSAR